jgi:hypothetical protein
VEFTPVESTATFLVESAEEVLFFPVSLEVQENRNREKKVIDNSFSISSGLAKDKQN